MKRDVTTSGGMLVLWSGKAGRVSAFAAKDFSRFTKRGQVVTAFSDRLDCSSCNDNTAIHCAQECRNISINSVDGITTSTHFCFVERRNPQAFEEACRCRIEGKITLLECICNRRSRRFETQP